MQADRRKWFYLVIGVCIVAVVSAVSFAVAAEKQDVGQDNAKEPNQEKVAAVNGAVITRADFDREMDGVKQQFLSLGQPMPEQRMLEIQNEVLENLISTELLHQMAEKEGIKVESSEVDEQLVTLKQRFPTEEEFKSVLEKMEFTESDLKTQLERGMVIEKYIDQQVVQKISVSDDEIKEYYSKNPSLFTQPEQVRASHILIKVEKDADASQKEAAKMKTEEIQAKLKEGGDFAALAKEYSQCPSSSKGGDLGYFRRGQMVKPFEDVAFALNPGELSDIVETSFGYHLIKVDDKKAETVLPLDTIKDRLAQYLKQERVEKEVTAYITKLKADAKIERYLAVAPAQDSGEKESKP